MIIWHVLLWTRAELVMWPAIMPPCFQHVSTFLWWVWEKCELDSHETWYTGHWHQAPGTLSTPTLLLSCHESYKLFNNHAMLQSFNISSFSSVNKICNQSSVFIIPPLHTEKLSTMNKYWLQSIYCFITVTSSFVRASRLCWILGMN